MSGSGASPVRADDQGDPDVEVLAGGVGNAGAVVRVGDHVLRPSSIHTPAIHALLGHLASVGFDGTPRVVGIDPDGRERLVHIAGDVPIPPFPAWSTTEEALTSSARLLRRFHDATVGFVHGPASRWSNELADPTPGDEPVLCHNDVCPENVVFRHGSAVALLDFEFAAPGRRVWDVACFARMCVPIETDLDASRQGRGGLDAVARLRSVADAYGLDPGERVELVEILTQQFDQGGEFVRRRMAAGEEAFIAMWEATGGQERIDRRTAWFAAERPRFLHALLD